MLKIKRIQFLQAMVSYYNQRQLLNDNYSESNQHIISDINKYIANIENAFSIEQEYTKTILTNMSFCSVIPVHMIIQMLVFYHSKKKKYVRELNNILMQINPPKELEALGVVKDKLLHNDTSYLIGNEIYALIEFIRTYETHKDDPTEALVNSLKNLIGTDMQVERLLLLRKLLIEEHNLLKYAQVIKNYSLPLHGAAEQSISEEGLRAILSIAILRESSFINQDLVKFIYRENSIILPVLYQLRMHGQLNQPQLALLIHNQRPFKCDIDQRDMLDLNEDTKIENCYRNLLQLLYMSDVTLRTVCDRISNVLTQSDSYSLLMLPNNQEYNFHIELLLTNPNLSDILPCIRLLRTRGKLTLINFNLALKSIMHAKALEICLRQGIDPYVLSNYATEADARWFVSLHEQPRFQNTFIYGTRDTWKNHLKAKDCDILLGNGKLLQQIWRNRPDFQLPFELLTRIGMFTSTMHTEKEATKIIEYALQTPIKKIQNLKQKIRAIVIADEFAITNPETVLLTLLQQFINEASVQSISTYNLIQNLQKPNFNLLVFLTSYFDKSQAMLPTDDFVYLIIAYFYYYGDYYLLTMGPQILDQYPTLDRYLFKPLKLLKEQERITEFEFLLKEVEKCGYVETPWIYKQNLKYRIIPEKLIPAIFKCLQKDRLFSSILSKQSLTQQDRVKLIKHLMTEYHPRYYPFNLAKPEDVEDIIEIYAGLKDIAALEMVDSLFGYLTRVNATHFFDQAIKPVLKLLSNDKLPDFEKACRYLLRMEHIPNIYRTDIGTKLISYLNASKCELDLYFAYKYITHENCPIFKPKLLNIIKWDKISVNPLLQYISVDLLLQNIAHYYHDDEHLIAALCEHLNAENCKEVIIAQVIHAYAFIARSQRSRQFILNKILAHPKLFPTMGRYEIAKALNLLCKDDIEYIQVVEYLIKHIESSHSYHIMKIAEIIKLIIWPDKLRFIILDRLMPLLDQIDNVYFLSEILPLLPFSTEQLETLKHKVFDYFRYREERMMVILIQLCKIHPNKDEFIPYLIKGIRSFGAIAALAAIPSLILTADELMCVISHQKFSIHLNVVLRNLKQIIDVTPIFITQLCHISYEITAVADVLFRLLPEAKSEYIKILIEKNRNKEHTFMGNVGTYLNADEAFHLLKIIVNYNAENVQTDTVISLSKNISYEQQFAILMALEDQYLILKSTRPKNHLCHYHFPILIDELRSHLIEKPLALKQSLYKRHQITLPNEILDDINSYRLRLA